MAIASQGFNGNSIPKVLMVIGRRGAVVNRTYFQLCLSTSGAGS